MDLFKVDQSDFQRFVEVTLKTGGLYSKCHETSDRVVYLNRIVKAFYNVVPFHNLGLWSLEPVYQELRAPSYSESVRLGLSSTGGLCWTQNVFMAELLQSQGFDAHVGPASVVNAGDHVVVIVHDVKKEGDVYVVEAGFGVPSFTAVALDFPTEKTSPVFQESFETYRYANENNKYIRQHKVKEGSTPIGEVSDGWFCAYSFLLDTVNPDIIRKEVDKGSYSDPESIFNKGIHMVVWNENKAVAIKNNTLMLEDDSGNWQKSPLISGDDIIKAVYKYFPTIPKDMVNTGIKNWCWFSDIGQTLAPPSI